MNLLLLFALLLTALPDDAARIRTAAEQALAARFPDAATRVEVRVRRLGVALDGAEAVAVDFAGSSLPRGTTQATIRAGGQTLGRVLLYVAHFDSVIVARQDMARDEEVSPETLAAAWIETTTFSGEPLTPHAFRSLVAEGAVFAARTLREGRPLRPTDLRLAFAAEPGQAVTMRYRRGPLALDIACTARQAGFPGEAIRLYAPATRRTYRARLTGAGTATWLETL